MSLKSIRESYQNLLTVFNDAGIKLNESQKSALDGFVLSLESTMSKQREQTIKKTKLAVEAKMEKEYQELFESIMKNMAKNHELASKIQSKTIAMTEQKKIAKKVDSYLDLYVESVLPKKTIVDYDRMQKLEKIHESLKESLAVNEDTLCDTAAKLEKTYAAKKRVCESEVARMKDELNRVNAKMNVMQKKFDTIKGAELLESKTKDLPTFEAKKVKKQLAGKTEKEITEKFDKTLKTVQADTAKKAEEMNATIDEEIEQIVNAKDTEVKENDLLKLTPSNGNGTAHNGHVDENFETMEIINYTESGDIALDESDKIDESLMAFWKNYSVEVR